MAAKSYIPEGYQSVTPILTFADCAAALDWYVQALGAVELARSVGPDGKIMHAVFKVGNSHIMAHDAMMGGKSPKDFGGSPAALWLYAEDPDKAFNRAIAAGATVVRPVEDMFWGDRCGTLKDPHGFAWTIACRKEDLTREEIDVRSAEFFKQMAGGPK